MPQDRLSLHVTRLLGRGPSADVYVVEATGRFNGRKALKLLHRRDAEQLARFEDERRLLIGLRHPALPAGLLAFELDSRPALLMELAEGITAARLLESLGALPPRAAVELVAQVADLLHDLHGASLDGESPLRLVHRNPRPEDLVVDAHGRVSLVRLGSARASFPERRALSRAIYRGDARRPDEVARQAGSQHPTLDTYELGLLLLGLSLGGLSNLPEDVQPARLHQIVAGLSLPDGLRQQIVAMTQARAQDRPSPGQAAAALRALVEKMPGNPLHTLAAGLVPAEAARQAWKGEAAGGLVGSTLRERADGSWAREAPWQETETLPEPGPPKLLDEDDREEGSEDAGPPHTVFVRQGPAPRREERGAAPPTAAPPGRPWLLMVGTGAALALLMGVGVVIGVAAWRGR